MNKKQFAEQARRPAGYITLIFIIWWWVFPRSLGPYSLTNDLMLLFHHILHIPLDAFADNLNDGFRILRGVHLVLGIFLSIMIFKFIDAMNK